MQERKINNVTSVWIRRKLFGKPWQLELAINKAKMSIRADEIKFRGLECELLSTGTVWVDQPSKLKAEPRFHYEYGYLQVIVHEGINSVSVKIKEQKTEE